MSYIKKTPKNLLSGEEAKIRAYPEKYYSILNDELTKVMEAKLTDYAMNNTDTVKAHQSFNSKTKKIKILYLIGFLAFATSGACFMNALVVIPFAGGLAKGYGCGGDGPLFPPIILKTLLPIAGVSLAIAVVVLWMSSHYWQSFAKEVKDFIKRPKHSDQATNTKQDEPVIGDLIDFYCNGQENVKPSAPLSPNFPDNHEATKDESSTSAQSHDRSRQSLYQMSGLDGLRKLELSSSNNNQLSPNNELRGVRQMSHAEAMDFLNSLFTGQ
ncbi:hypothetical protein [Candidatus Wolbachia massiliensis]|uniref:Uncharacterized protein n=1 Tax=Candidatus Wolbachia massiliensis TaxID=1845000 RepID=A0A7M3U2F3_9RICK|nr:hypothetical protein [Candidatus Wolbachia massiliensis]QOD38588.1 hypothetical protein ID128_01760 [Candidatus Wolbachia massiliensis]